MNDNNANSSLKVMTEWLDNFEKEAESPEEMKEWIYVLMMYIWKGEVIESDNRFVRLALNNVMNNWNRMKIKQELYQSQNGGRPANLPSDRIYKMRAEGKTAKEIAEILTAENIWGTVIDKQVHNSAGWKKYGEDKKNGAVSTAINTGVEEDKATPAAFNF